MKIFSLCLGFALLAAPAMAQTPVENVAPLPVAPKLATVTPFITGLKEPQGMAFNTRPIPPADPYPRMLSFQRTLLVCDYGAGEILQFDQDGKSLGALATGLKGPSEILSERRINLYRVHEGAQPNGDPIAYVTERGANRVVALESNGTTTPHGGEISGPIGLVYGADGLKVVSHSTSRVYRWQNAIPILSEIAIINGSSRPRLSPTISRKRQWEVLYNAATNEGGRSGFRSIVDGGGTYFLSDDLGGRIWMMTEGGQIAPFASGISQPSGLAIGPDNEVYVANEGDGGQLIRLGSEGEKTVVAEKLGRPCGILFLEAKTLLVSNRDGNIWKVALP